MATMIRAGVREAIQQADELSRRAHEERHDPIAEALDSLRTALVHIDEALGGGRSPLPIIPRVAQIVDQLAGFVDRVGPDVRAGYASSLSRFRHVVASLERDLDSVAPSLELESKPLLGVLPLARIVPQDLHSIVDYVSGGTCIGTAAFAETTSARIAGAALGASGICVSLLTDYRLSAAKVIPIESHEAIDHLWGLTAIAAPFVLGYWKKDPAVAAIHVLTGASTILMSLFTDYRAAEGVGRTGEEIREALHTSS